MTVVETSNRRDFGGFSIFERILVFVLSSLHLLGLFLEWCGIGINVQWFQRRVTLEHVDFRLGS